MNKDCLFCKIADKKLPSTMVYEDNKVVAFNDIDPKAPVHILIVPKKHIETIDDVKQEDEQLIGYMVMIAQKLARENNISDSGYRLVFNVKNHGGQFVDHIHLHLLGGKPLGHIV